MRLIIRSLCLDAAPFASQRLRRVEAPHGFFAYLLRASPVGNKLYVGNLAYSVRDDSLLQAFSQFGHVASAKVMMDRETGRSKGFGFVEMGSDAEAQAAINGMNGQALEGRAVVVNEARPREESAAGGGGGRRWRRWPQRRRWWRRLRWWRRWRLRRWRWWWRRWPQPLRRWRRRWPQSLRRRWPQRWWWWRRLRWWWRRRWPRRLLIRPAHRPLTGPPVNITFIDAS